LNAVDFAEWAYSVFDNDERYKKYLGRLSTPSKDAKRKSQISGVAGHAVAKTVGIGWRSVLSASIMFKEHPILIMNVQDHKEPGRQKVRFIFGTRWVTRDDIKKMGIKQVKEGIINRKVVGVKMESECTGKLKIKQDNELMENLLQLFKVQDFCDISNWTPYPMTVEIAVKDNIAFGKIEAGIYQLNEEGLKMLFDTVTKVSLHINSELEKNRLGR
jgi:hypothetical protein